MKIQKVQIYNIASFEKVEIDFEKSPLSDSALFLICGNTGTGKTTILDAICLALYNDAPRVHRLKNPKTPAVDDMQEDVQKPNDVRQLMRRGTAEASATVHFVGNNGQPYEAVWSVARARKKIDGNMQAVKWSWTNLQNQTVWTKNQDITTQIQATIGLDFNQFCRTTMLAQGEFSKFLFASEQDKADILEKLTNTERFSKIGAKIFEKQREKTAEYDKAKAALGVIKLLSPEELDELQNALNNLAAQIEETKTAQVKNDQNKKWIEDQLDFANQLKEETDTLNGLQKQIESEDYKSSCQLVADWDNTITARQSYTALQEQQNLLSGIQKKSTLLQSEFQNLTGQEAGFLKLLKQKENEAKENTAILSQQDLHKTMLKQADTVLAHLSNYQEAQAKITNCKQKLFKEQENLPTYNQAVKEAGAKKDLSERQNKEKQEEINQKNDLLSAQDQEKLNRQYQEITDKNALISLAKVQVSTLKEKDNNLQDAQKNLTEQQAEKAKALVTQTVLKQEVEVAQTHYDSARDLYDKMKEAVSDKVKEIRQTLHTGDICPVCGQKINKNLKDEDFVSVLQPIEEQWKAAEATLKEKQNQKNRIDVEIKNLDIILKQQLTAIEKGQNELKKAQEEVEKSCKNLTIEVNISHLDTILNEEEQKAKTQSADLKNKMDFCSDLQKSISSLQKEKDALQNSLNKAQSQCTANTKNLETCKSSIHNIQELINTHQETCTQIVQTLNGIMTIKDWFTYFNADWQAFMKDLKHKADKYNDAEKNMRDLSEKIKSALQITEQIKEIKTGIMTDFPDWQRLSFMEKVPDTKMLSLWTNLHTNVKLNRNQKDAAENAIQSLSEQLQLFYAQHSAISATNLQALCRRTDIEISQIRDSNQQIQKRLATQRGASAAAKKTLEEHTLNKPEIEATETIETLSEKIEQQKREIDDKNKVVGSISQQLKDNEYNRKKSAEQQKEVLQKEQEKAKWDGLCGKIGDSKGTRFRALIQSYVLKEMLNSANFYLTQLSKRYALTCTGLSLSVTDSFLGGALRPVSSLSGGESFLVSLALALGLSNVSGSRLKVEMLFIDEGFGTLSDDYLTTVMNALEKLNKLSNRKIGVISHVTGLRERIATHIEVEREGMEPSSVKVVG